MFIFLLRTATRTIKMATEREKEKEKVFSKTDMERVALFQEMGYICIGDKYKAANSRTYLVL